MRQRTTCGVCADPDRKALRFNLMRQVAVDGKKTTRGAGGCYLCERCWKELVEGSQRRGGSVPK